MAKNFWQSSHYNQWLFDRQEILLARATDLAIFSEEEYQKLMIFFSNVIQALGELSKVKQQVIATATVYFKRFYSRYSLKCIDPFLMIPTCVFLASKVEESGIMSSNKLIPNYQTVLKSKFSHAGIEDLNYRISHVWEAEFFLLELLDCCLILYLPYRPLRQVIAPEFEKNQSGSEKLMYTTWRIVNDSLRTDVCLLYPPYQIALGCLFVAGKLLDQDLTQWFAELSVDMDKVMDIVRYLLHLYELWKGFDERKEIQGLIQRMPKPSPSRPPSAQSQPSQSRQQVSQHLQGDVKVDNYQMGHMQQQHDNQLPGWLGVQNQKFY